MSYRKTDTKKTHKAVSCLLIFLVVFFAMFAVVPNGVSPPRKAYASDTTTSLKAEIEQYIRAGVKLGDTIRLASARNATYNPNGDWIILGYDFSTTPADSRRLGAGAASGGLTYAEQYAEAQKANATFATGTARDTLEQDTSTLTDTTSNGAGLGSDGNGNVVDIGHIVPQNAISVKLIQANAIDTLSDRFSYAYKICSDYDTNVALNGKNVGLGLSASEDVRTWELSYGEEDALANAMHTSRVFAYCTGQRITWGTAYSAPGVQRDTGYGDLSNPGLSSDSVSGTISHAGFQMWALSSLASSGNPYCIGSGSGTSTSGSYLISFSFLIRPALIVTNIAQPITPAVAITIVDPQVDVPQTGDASLDCSTVAGTGYTASNATWNRTDVPVAASADYTATVRLTADSANGYAFVSGTSLAPSGWTLTIESEASAVLTRVTRTVDVPDSGNVPPGGGGGAAPPGGGSVLPGDSVDGGAWDGDGALISANTINDGSKIAHTVDISWRQLLMSCLLLDIGIILAAVGKAVQKYRLKHVRKSTEIRNKRM
ncbi:MAG: hypothetical protein LBM21_00255 [Coriobacteriales bacterium]|jgi:hypothetical protein|nr:hypothetical protein [Coriobacteriales bacterium]